MVNLFVFLSFLEQLIIINSKIISKAEQLCIFVVSGRGDEQHYIYLTEGCEKQNPNREKEAPFMKLTVLFFFTP